ncbi:substrate-binding domain-containing protein [Providencia sp. Je.9.19]|uniref:substrate-binding domain-containing protein n=1 Tax=unclassified Providencia TaxID=2633465 RepID=UPI003DA98C0C
MASKWIVTTGKADIFIGYQHYKKRIEQEQGLSVIDIPADFNVTATYTMALLNKSANAFMSYLTHSRKYIFGAWIYEANYSNFR